MKPSIDGHPDDSRGVAATGADRHSDRRNRPGSAVRSATLCLVAYVAIVTGTGMAVSQFITLAGVG